MIIDEHQTAGPSMSDVEAELCRLPDVVAVRIVEDAGRRPVEVHVLAHTGKHAKQVVRDVQSVALASFGIVQMAIPYLLFSRDLKSVSPHEAGMITLLEPVATPGAVEMKWGQAS